MLDGLAIFENHSFRKYSRGGILVKFGEMLWLGTTRTNDWVQQRSSYRWGL